ncbi:MAG: hypothetical protein DA408_03630 [Bacteroidetes bacterium]|nr:MAG: hypothetical protein C7N36_19560 [Bacteroidota bacterium]PTM14171.1 MAG: hypothetical protein DA408_03630 [Bacteroidota bacterium]
MRLLRLAYLDTKANANVDANLSQLAQIETVKNLQIGTFWKLGDERALATYDVLMEMGFTDEAAYRAHQQHPLHLQVKAQFGAYLAGPLATYDYQVR